MATGLIASMGRRASPFQTRNAMRSFSLAGPLLAAACLVSPALAQELQINQRLTTPTAQADAYAGMTVGRLILVLGLSLQGVPPSYLRGDAFATRLHELGVPCI